MSDYAKYDRSGKQNTGYLQPGQFRNEKERKEYIEGAKVAKKEEEMCKAGCIAGTTIGCMACGTGTPAGCVAGACGGITGAVLGDNLHGYMYPPDDTKKMDRGGRKSRRRKSHKRKSHRRKSHRRKSHRRK